MAFRADEAERAGFEKVANFLIPPGRFVDEKVRIESRYKLEDIVDELGPVVDSYPSWHPLVCNHDSRRPVTLPSSESRYRGLDHTRFFRNGFITCPYNDGQEVIDSVEALPEHPVALITAQRLDVKFYNDGCTPILVKCNWARPMENSGMIPLSVAVPLILEQEVPCWRWSSVAETWASMRHYLLGSPHGSRSSLFVSQETGQGIKKVWETLIYTGMFGPIKV